MRTVAVVLPGIQAHFTVDDVPTGHSGSTDATGYGEVLLSNLTVTRVTVTADGYQPYAAEGVIVPMYDNFQFRIGVPRDPNRPEDVSLPPLVLIAPPAPFLSVQGHDFVDAHGQRVMLNACDAFLDFRLFKDGGAAALAPFMDEANELGFTARRVFLQGSIQQNQVMQLDPKEPGYYDLIAPFVEYELAHGIIPILTIGVDNQDIQSPIEHWVKIDALTRGQSRIISFFNEWSKNKSTFGPADIPAASGLWSRGSDVGDAAPPKPCGPVVEFHPVRNYATAMRDAVASPIELFEVQGYPGALLIDEPGRLGTNAHDARFGDPRACEDYARAFTALCAGACMHNHFGQRGQLMDAQTRACAEAWTRGLTL